MFAKKCTTQGCDRAFTLSGKPHKELTGICPGCGQEVKLADAKEQPEPADVKEATK